jgi:hypothetical protein
VQVLHPPNVIIIIAWVEIINPLFQSKISIVIGVDIVFASTRFCNEFFNLRLHFLDWFLLFITHGESELLCDYNEIMCRYCHCIAVPWGGRATSIQGIKEGSLLLLLVLAVKNEGGVGCYEKGIVPKEWWNPKMLNLNGTYAGSSIENVSNGKIEMTSVDLFQKESLLLSVLELKNNFKNLKINFKL